MLNYVASLLCLFVVATSLSCTRQAANSSLKLSFNSSSSNSNLSVTGKLDFAVINVQLPTGPFVKEFEFHDNPVPAGQEIVLEVPNVPKGSFLVQFLGVYKDDGAAGQFVYGDAYAVQSGADAVANITAASIGNFASEGRVTGRYFTQSAPETGPTGQMIMQFQPPGGKPKMNIHPFPIVDGWFSVMALDGAAMDYVLLPSNETVFSQVTLDGGVLKIGGSAVATGSHLAHIKTPAYFAYEDSGPRARPSTDLYVGYFQKTGLGLSLSATKKVCYPTSVQEAMPGLFLTNTAGVLSNPVEVNTVSPGTNDIKVVAGGIGAAMTNLYTTPSTACSTATPQDRIVLYHSALGGDEDRSAGISAPFKAIRPFARWDQFISAVYSAAPNTLNLTWEVVPSIPSVEGYTVFSKYSANGGSDNGGDRECATLSKDGYSEAGDINNPATTSYAFTHASLDSNTKYNWRFAICAFRTVGGKKEFVGNYIDGGQIGGSADEIHTGWANVAKVQTGTSTETYSGLGGAQQRVISVDATTSPLYTVLNLYSSMTLAAGDEVMISVIGMNGAAACGSASGETIAPGKFGFARVLSIASTTLKVSKGAFIDQLNGLANIAASPGSSPMCHVQVAKVLQYRTLNLASTTSLTTDLFNNYATSGGQLPIRVNGVLTLGASTVIDANAKGFAGGTVSYIHGAGIGGPSNGVTPMALGGQGTSTSTQNGSGGAGYGGGGGGTYPSTAGFSQSGMYRFLFGGGGGSGGNASNGGTGAGAVFIIAKETQISSGAAVEARGANGGSASGDGGGGGGGGSIIFMTGALTGSGGLNFYANGGNGGTATAGVGGGGSVTATACSAASATINAYATKGSVGSSSGATDGMTDTSATNNQYVCRLIR